MHAIIRPGVAWDFAQRIASDAGVAIRGLLGSGIPPGASLQRVGLTKFVADVHLRKLTRDLRLLGLDVSYSCVWEHAELVRRSVAERRALLTRDRRLLMHRVVGDGYYLRSADPERQVVEVLDRFQIRDRVQPFVRCSACNGLLEPVAKAEIIDQLEPLTRLHYDAFRRCRSCRKIFWAGSHFAKIEPRLRRLCAEVRMSAP